MFHSSPDTSVDVETVQTLDRGAFSSTDIPKSLKKYPDSSSTSPETIVELEKQTSEIRTSYRTVSVALFEFGDKLLALKEKVKKARLKWSDWLQYHFPDTNKQTKDAMAIARICRQLRDTECHLVEKMRGWGTPVIAVLCRGGIELVKKFLSENDNPVGWTVKAVKTFVQQWKQPNGCNSKRKQSTRSVAPKSAKPNFEPAPGSTTNRRLILELARLRKLKATLNEELDVSVTKEVRDKLKQDILHADIKIERAIELLIESSTPGATSNHQPETDAAESQLESSVQIEEQLRQENTSLKAKLEQLETQQHFNSNPHSPKVTAAREQYQLQMSALIVQLEQQQQENARLLQLFQEKEAFWVQSVSFGWRTQKQALEHKIAELEKALQQKKSTAVDPSNDVTVNRELTWKPDDIVRITQHSAEAEAGKIGRFDCRSIHEKNQIERVPAT
jgi:BMFP domain-containing protein YqiC